MYGDVELELCYTCGLKNSECHSCTAGAGSDHDRMGTKHDVLCIPSCSGGIRTHDILLMRQTL